MMTEMSYEPHRGDHGSRQREECNGIRWTSVEPQSGRTVRIGERDIYVVEMGDGPPLVMLHGGGPGASGMPNFARNASVLSRSFRLIVPDMPGYGRSTKGVDRNDPFGDLARSMLGLLDALNVGKAHLLGNSLGGAAALRLAIEAPDRVDRLVLLGPGGIELEPAGADRGPPPSARLLFRRRPHAREMRAVPPQGSGVRRGGAA